MCSFTERGCQGLKKIIRNWKRWLRLLRKHAEVEKNKKKTKKTRHVKNGFESQNSQLPLFYCSEPALPAVRLGGRETRPLVAAWDWFQSPSVLCPSQITIHFWLPRFSSVWIQKALWGSLTNTMSRHLTGRLWRAVWRTRDGICAISTRESTVFCVISPFLLCLWEN